jgi:hypothetical protein
MVKKSVKDRKIPGKYVPKTLSANNRKKQKAMIIGSRQDYIKGIYKTRKKVASFKSKVSPHILRARKIYGVDKIVPSQKLAKATGCSIKGLKQIVKKGEGAYYSSGSRPNQTAPSWAYARLGSTITGGNASKVDYHILRDECKAGSKALRLAQKPKSESQAGGRTRKTRKKKGKRKKKSNYYKMDINNPPRRSDQTIIFSDRDDFRPNLTPREIFQLGSFGGTYWRPIESSVVNKRLKNVHKKYPKNWWDGIPEDHLTRDFTNYDKSINKYGVKAGTTLDFWEEKGWITEYNPYGWVQWYCDFYNGRRCPDDERQIRRWKKFSSNKGRFRNSLIRLVQKHGKTWDDYSVSPVIRQGLQHWGYVLTKKDFDDRINLKNKSQQ